jgi:hypothetical protein
MYIISINKLCVFSIIYIENSNYKIIGINYKEINDYYNY